MSESAISRKAENADNWRTEQGRTIRQSQIRHSFPLRFCLESESRTRSAIIYQAAGSPYLSIYPVSRCDAGCLQSGEVPAMFANADRLLRRANGANKFARRM